ncbi:hypothetical protein [Sphingomonas sp. UBA978]|jgi:hypothetical protein|nr:hypothetical protein [Sphingomonas sp. UBA978]
MERPVSIVKFERCYLGALFVGLINLLISWNKIQAMPAVRQAAALIGEWYLPVTTVLGFVFPVVIWYFVARRSSLVAKWIVTIVFCISVLGLLFNLLMKTFVSPPSAVLSIFAAVLNGIAIVMLFRPDAKIWFGEGLDEDDLETPLP